MSKNRTVEAQNRASTMRAPEPLTLEQLRGMRGKWVWIVLDDPGKEIEGWALVAKEHVFTYKGHETEGLVERVVYPLCDYGAWIAYEYPPDYFRQDTKMVPLTLQQLEGLEEPTPVWWATMGMWCLARRGMITTPTGRTHDVIELSGLFYAYPTIKTEAWEPCEVCMEQDDPCLKDNCFRKSGRVCGYNCDKLARYMNNAKRIHDANFCPHCGRPLTPEAWAILERRLRGCMG